MTTQANKTHTPTPWKIESNVKYPKALIYACDESLKPYQRSLASCHTDDGKNGDANATFIVKAVNSHEKLLKIAQDALEYYQLHGVKGACIAKIKQALAAVKE